ncbi:MAG: hypothetical protein J6Y25_01900 [Elusimicrobiaceae bacterium]|nr:hypothetical protein [Elusimicrobiaceae bacterium]
MALDNNLDGSNDIAHFLEKFKESPYTKPAEPDLFSPANNNAGVRPAQYARSFEKLEQKIHELEAKFEASTTQNQLILSELARTRDAIERQKDKDAFLEHLSRTISTLRTSVENLSRAQQTQSFAFREAPVQRSFDPLPSVFAPTQSPSAQAYEAQEQETLRLKREREEQDRLFNSLRQKASQLKAVNNALGREIKKAQQEKMEALKKTADQAKEILSLRDQLTAAEEHFKAFDFEGRIISIKQEYQEKVSSLQTQLKEMSDTCVKQVEEIESLKNENTKLQHASAEKEALQAQLAGKEQEMNALKATMAALQNKQADQHAQELASFTQQLRSLEEQRNRLTLELEQSQISVENIRREKAELENNFKQLRAQIDQNDAVIAQLKQKIEVLGQQNEELTNTNRDLLHHNEDLLQTNAVLTQDNTSLSHTNVELTHRNAALAQHNSKLSHRTEELETQKTNLSRQIVELETANQATVRQAPQVPVSAPAPVSNAALTAARLVQQHLQETASQAGSDAAQNATSDSLRRPTEPVLHSLGRRLTPSSSEEAWEMVSATISRPTHIKSEEDLPEIKVTKSADSSNLFDGEDFLEKTDSFIGRMKWSIFRESR